MHGPHSRVSLSPQTTQHSALVCDASKETHLFRSGWSRCPMCFVWKLHTLVSLEEDCKLRTRLK